MDATPQPTTQTSSPTLSKRKILYVEDGQALSRVMYNKLTREGFDVILAADGVEGLRRIEAEKPNLVLLDLILPNMNGIEVLQNLKDKKLLTPAMPVLVFSNLGQESDVKRCMELGATAYFVKSDMSINEVVEKIRAHLPGQSAAVAATASALPPKAQA